MNKDISPQEEQELILQIMQGNQEAFRIIVNKYQISLLNYLFRFTGKYEIAEEIAQDTFFVVYKKIKKFNIESSFRPWIFAIATNHACNYLRKHSPIYNNDALLIASKNKEPAEEMWNKEQSLAVQKALAALPEKQRAIFILRFYEQFSYEEIAETLQCPIGTVKSRICYTIKKLKTILSSYE